MAVETASPKPEARWPGVVFSLIVPGFGLFRAGQWIRGIIWFVGLRVVSFIVAAVVASEHAPMAAGVAAFIGGIGVAFWMWCDSFRIGRMTWKLWGLFAALFLLSAFLPSPAGFVVHAFRMPTHSMEPTLLGERDGGTPDHIIVNGLSYLLAKPRRGDLIAFSISSIPGIADKLPAHTGEVYFIKRIVGLPGERIEIKDGSVFADGQKLGGAQGLPSVRYVEPTIPTMVPKAGDAYVVGENEYFVLGDNSPNSSDSRYWGCVPSSNICGKATKIYFPFNRMGTPK